jgi:hypothetical protein
MVPGNPASVLSPQPNADRLIPCVAGIRPIPHSLQNEFWIRSPKTGRELRISDGWRTELEIAAPRLVARIAHARSTGQAVIEFTVSELKAFADLAAKIAEHCRPKPGVYANYRIKPGRRRGWFNR